MKIALFILISIISTTVNADTVQYSKVTITKVITGYNTNKYFCIEYKNSRFTDPKKACLNGALTQEKQAYHEIYNMVSFANSSRLSVRVYIRPNIYSSSDNNGISRDLLKGVSTCNATTCL